MGSFVLMSLKEITAACDHNNGDKLRKRKMQNNRMNQR
jgi:hypothetical protein